MRRVLLALFFITASTLMAAPVMADETGSTESVSSEGSPEPTPSEEPPASEDPPPPPPEDTTTPDPEPTTPSTGDPSPGADQNSGSDQGGNSGGSTPNEKKVTNSQDDPVDDLGDTVEGKTVKVCQASGSGTFTTGYVSALSVQDGSGVGGGDIVKPFSYSGGGFGGLNWDTGKSIYNNDCTAPSDAPAPGGGAITAPCVTDTVALLEGDTTEEPSAAPNPGCEEALVEALAIVKKVTICHANNGIKPYGPSAVSVSVQSIFNPNNGHDTHDGGVFPADPHGDIIPPFEAESGSYPGQNWGAEGQAIFFNDCQIPGGEEPPPPGENKVPICHARNFGQGGDPYNRPNPSVEGILNGHAGHTGPVFFEGIQEQWGDIIPPFDFGPGAQFDGLNWDTDGQAIYFNNCNVTGGGDDDDGDGDDDGDDDGDGDDDKEAALPDTGGPSQWSLVIGVLMTLLGMAIISNRESLVRAGLFQLVPVEAASQTQPSTVGRHAADVPTVEKPETHLGRWTALGAGALVVMAVFGRRPSK